MKTGSRFDWDEAAHGAWKYPCSMQLSILLTYDGQFLWLIYHEMKLSDGVFKW